MNVRVTCKRDSGIWRAGRFWVGASEVELEREAIEVLRNEPLLVVSVQQGAGWKVVSKAVANVPDVESEVVTPEELVASIEKLRTQLREERDVHQAEMSRLLLEVEATREKHQELTSDNDGLRTHNEQLQATVRDLRAQLDDARRALPASLPTPAPPAAPASAAPASAAPPAPAADAPAPAAPAASDAPAAPPVSPVSPKKR